MRSNFFPFFNKLLIYLIGYHLRGRQFGLVSLAAASLIAASYLFGRMIGQEPLVLCFALLTLRLNWATAKVAQLLSAGLDLRHPILL